jgi:hypothetical protein
MAAAREEMKARGRDRLVLLPRKIEVVEVVKAGKTSSVKLPRVASRPMQTSEPPHVPSPSRRKFTPAPSIVTKAALVTEEAKAAE